MQENRRVLFITTVAFLGVFSCNVVLNLLAGKASLKFKGLVYQSEPVVRAYYRTYKPLKHLDNIKLASLKLAR